MTTFKEIREINVNQYVEKKGKFNYLSWAWAVDQLLCLDPQATWEYNAPTYFHNQSMMVYCAVTAFGKTMTAQLPVMDNYNKPIIEPDAMQVNTAMQRCLAKAIALHGLGLYIYQGEDLPDTTPEPIDIQPLRALIAGAGDLNTLKIVYVDGIKKCGSNAEAKSELEKAKDKRKAELEANAKNMVSEATPEQKAKFLEQENRDDKSGNEQEAQ